MSPVLCLRLFDSLLPQPDISQIRETASRKAHNLEVVGSTPASATRLRHLQQIIIFDSNFNAYECLEMLEWRNFRRTSRLGVYCKCKPCFKHQETGNKKRKDIIELLMAADRLSNSWGGLLYIQIFQKNQSLILYIYINK